MVHFWAPWCEPCKQMDEVLAALASEAPAATQFLRVSCCTQTAAPQPRRPSHLSERTQAQAFVLGLQVEAEEVDELAERYDVSAVPHFLILKARCSCECLCLPAFRPAQGAGVYFSVNCSARCCDVYG